MRIGNHDYNSPEDLPGLVPIFPLSGALLLPRTNLPLNIFEPRYLQMIDSIIGGTRLIAMIQPTNEPTKADPKPPLSKVGCLGRLVGFQETGDGCYLITLQGVCRFTLGEEHATATPYRVAHLDYDAFRNDFTPGLGAAEVDRPTLLNALEQYLTSNNLEPDWDSIHKADTESLVNALCVLSPFGAPEKQALLEAPDLKTRAATLVAITQMKLTKLPGGEGAPTLQ